MKPNLGIWESGNLGIWESGNPEGESWGTRLRVPQTTYTGILDQGRIGARVRIPAEPEIRGIFDTRPPIPLHKISKDP